MTLEVQFLSMLASACTGIWFGASFDTYKRFTKGYSKARFIQFVNDLLFWLLQALIFFYVLFIVNYGEIRFYFFLALLLGYATYRALLESLYNRTLETVITVVDKTVHFFVKFIKVLLINPTISLLKLLFSFGMIIVTALVKVLQFAIKIVVFPFRWVGNKYVQAFGIPFHSVYKKAVHRFRFFWKKDDDDRRE